MRIIPRFRLRTALLAVAAVAVLSGAFRDYRYRLLRDSLARSERNSASAARIYERERDFCEAEAGKRPYDPVGRTGVIFSQTDRWEFFSNWDAERAFHAEMADLCRQAEASYAEEKRDAERHLTFP